MMYWALILAGLAIVAIFALAATGAFGEQKVEDDWENPDLTNLIDLNLPIALFGYRRSTVDSLLQQLEAERSKPQKGE
jgi:hypothetical protein